MSLQIIYNTKTLGFGSKSSFQATGGVSPYTYSIAPNGIGGAINGSGVYTAPSKVGTDTIKVVDSAGRVAVQKVFVGTPLHLICDIIQRELVLADGRVYIYDQKLFMPTDEGLFVAVSLVSLRAFGNQNKFNGTTGSEEQSANFYGSVQIDIISRGTDALYRKEEVVMALRSNYAERQQELNSFALGTIPTGFTNLSQIDGSAIPYRFTITLGIQYQVRKTSSTSYFDDFEEPSITVDP